MKTNRAYWVEKMRVARKAWATLRPLDRPKGNRATKVDFLFITKRVLAPGLEYQTLVQGHHYEDTWWFDVDLALYDAGPAALRSFVENDDKSGLALFGVAALTAANFLEGGKNPLSRPRLALHAGDEEMARHLAVYSRSIDRLWQFAGGYSVESFRKLAIWLMRNREHVGLHSPGLRGPIFAALEYGQRDLVLRFVGAVEEEWAGYIEREPHSESVRTIYAKVQTDLARLRGLMDLPPKT